MNEFLYARGAQTYQSVPVVAFFTRDFEYLYHYTGLPAIFHKDRLIGALFAARSGETRNEAFDRGIREWRSVQDSPFFWLWGSAAIDEMLSGLYERIIVGAR